MKYFLLLLLFSLQVLGATRVPPSGLSVTAGGVLVGGPTGIGTTTPAGTLGQALFSQGGTSTPAWKNVSAGVKNYTPFGDAESGVTAFNTYNNTAGVAPVTGSGGSPVITWTASATLPLAGTNSFVLAKSAANRQGDGVSYAFTIDSQDQAKVLQISFNYLVSSGTFVAGTSTTASDVTVWIYDVTNAVIIQPSSINLLSNSTTLADKFNATFQTASNSTSYRLIFHVGSTSALAYNLKVDSIAVSPSTYVYGTPITDWVAYTPTITGHGTPSGVAFYSRRVGQDLEVRGGFTSGTTTAVNSQISIGYGGVNGNVVIDSTKIYTAGYQNTGTMSYNQGGVSYYQVLAPQTNQSYVNLGVQNVSGSGMNPSQQIPGTGGASSFHFSVPIVGWSSSVQTSDQTDTRIVAAKYRFTTAKNASTTLPYNFDTVIYDTHGAVTPSATVWKFAAPIPGFYRVMVSTGAPGSSASTGIYKNGVLSETINTSALSLNNGTEGAAATIQLNSGDYIDIRLDTSISGILAGNFAIERISGPSSIAATESINASYTTAAGQSVAGAAITVVDFGTKEFDSHGTVTTGASWKFTALISGKFKISSFVKLASAGWTLGSYVRLAVYKNGNLYRYLRDETVAVTGTYSYPQMGGTTSVQLLAGEYIDVRVSQNEGARALVATAANNFVDIERVGN